MSKQQDKLTNIVKKAFAHAIEIRSEVVAIPDNYTAEHMFHYDGEFEHFRVYTIRDDNEAPGEHGVAWTRWEGNDITDIVWTFDGNTDLLWSNNNQAALVYVDKVFDSEQQNEVITEDALGNEDTVCEHCNYFTSYHHPDCIEVSK